jgi:hypothetical protein
MMKVLMHLLTCHDHTITVVQTPPSIRGSQMAMNCIQEVSDATAEARASS